MFFFRTSYAIIAFAGVVTVACGKPVVDSASKAQAQNLNRTGLTAVQTGDFATALTHFEQARKLDPTVAEYPNNAGMALFKLNRLDVAARAFAAAIKLNPESGLYYLNQGSAYSAMGDQGVAIELFQKSIELDPTSFTARYQLGLAYFNSQKQDKAREAWEMALQYGDSVEMETGLGIIAMNKDQDVDAGTYFERALKIKSDFPQLHYNLGVLHQKKKAFSKAEDAYLQSIKLDPKSFIAYYNLAMVQIQLSKKDKAIETLTKFLTLLPDGFPQQRADAEKYLRELQR